MTDVVAELLLPHWAQLDADENGKVSRNEWNDFFDKVSNSELGKEMAADGESLIVDLFINGGYDMGDVGQ